MSPSLTIDQILAGRFRHAGWCVQHQRVERIWRQEGRTSPKTQPPRRQLWLTEGAWIQLRVTHANHVWAYAVIDPDRGEPPP